MLNLFEATGGGRAGLASLFAFVPLSVSSVSNEGGFGRGGGGCCLGFGGLSSWCEVSSGFFSKLVFLCGANGLVAIVLLAGTG